MKAKNKKSKKITELKKKSKRKYVLDFSNNYLISLKYRRPIVAKLIKKCETCSGYLYRTNNTDFLQIIFNERNNGGEGESYSNYLYSYYSSMISRELCRPIPADKAVNFLLINHETGRVGTLDLTMKDVKIIN